MIIDPTRWLISIAGFGYDWIMTRPWVRMLTACIPLLVLLLVGYLVYWGRSLDRLDLAEWYVELGEAEIEGWETAWTGAPAKSQEVDAAADYVESQGEQPDAEKENTETNEDADANANGSRSTELSEFADLLFRRAQLLSPSNRGQFVIGASLAQRGAVEQGIKLISEIAPDDSRGYMPAHAYLAVIYKDQVLNTKDLRLANRLKHHISQCKSWERVPAEVLSVGSDLYWHSRDYPESLNLLALAAERDPIYNLRLAARAKEAKNERVHQQAVPIAERYFLEKLDQNAGDDQSRAGLAQLYANEGMLDQAEETLRDGVQPESSPMMRRGLSEVYRLRFLQSLKKGENAYTADIEFLNIAMKLDPTNELVAEEVAKLARVEGPRPTQEMISMLQTYLAEGRATALTHAWLAETYLIREDFKSALPHLQQVVTRLPNASQYLNNLAFVLADLHPDKLEEALEYAQRSVMSADAAGSPRADFYDTLGMVLEKLGRNTEAIAAFESAVSMAPSRIDFHVQVARLYEKEGNQVMADRHRDIIELIEKAKAEQEAAAETQEGETQEGQDANQESAEPSNGNSSESEEAPAEPADDGSNVAEDPPVSEGSEGVKSE